MTGKEPTRISERIAQEPQAITGPTLTMRLFSFDDSPDATFDFPEGLSKAERHNCKSFLEAAKLQVIESLQDANVEGAVEALLETRHANALEVRFRGPVSRLTANDSRRVCLHCQVFAMAEPDESDESTRSFRAFTPAEPCPDHGTADGFQLGWPEVRHQRLAVEPGELPDGILDVLELAGRTAILDVVALGVLQVGDDEFAHAQGTRRIEQLTPLGQLAVVR